MNPFLPPMYPDILHISPNTSQFTISKSHHEEVLTGFAEYNSVHRKLIQKVIKTVEAKPVPK